MNVFGNLFGKPKTPKMPEVQKLDPPVIAMPEDGEAAEDAMKSAKKRSGYARTILTGALSPKRR